MTTTALPSAQDSPRVSPAEEVKHTGRKHGVGFYVAWACFILILLITVFPFSWMLRSSLTSIFHDGPVWGWSAPVASRLF